MRTITDWVSNNTLNTVAVHTTGETPMLIGDVVFEDVSGYNLGSRFDSVSGKIDNNFAEGGLNFNTGANLSSNTDALITNYQLPHKTYRGEGAFIYPHIHWIQTDTNLSDWKVEYRVLNGGVIGGWIEQDKADYLGIRKTYPGSGDFVQITSFAPISIAGLDLSSIIQIRMWRDTTSVGNTDTISGDVCLVYTDAHVPLTYLGSQEELTQ